MKKLLYLFVTIYLCNFAVVAQDATAYLNAAKEELEKRNYTVALSHADMSEKRLGKNDPLIEAVRTECYLKMKKYDKCITSANKYFSLKPPEDDVVSLHVRSMMATAQKRFDHGFIGLTGDTQSYFGLTVGEMKGRKIGWYVFGRMNTKFFSPFASSNNIGKYDEENNVVKTSGKDLKIEWLDNELLPVNANFGAGLSKKIIYPLWVYAGAGVSYDTYVRKVRTDDMKEDETKWCSMKPTWKPMLDAGLSVDLAIGVALNAGIRASSIDNLYFTFGVLFKIY